MCSVGPHTSRWMFRPRSTMRRTESIMSSSPLMGTTRAMYTSFHRCLSAPSFLISSMAARRAA